MTTAYAPLRPARDLFVPVRGLSYHLLLWGDPGCVAADRPPLVMAHGWMDVAASFQFVVDALTEPRFVIALDWRGFGLTEAPHADGYWFPDYLGDLDALLDAPALGLPAGMPVDLLGHSMGGNVAMLYAGVRPQRVRRLINLEGFGMPATTSDAAPKRYAQWLDELKQPARLKPYASLAEVAQRLVANNPRLPADRAAWLAQHWSRRGDDGQWALLADPAHKHVNPVLSRVDETLACWRRIEAPVLFVEGDADEVLRRWAGRYTREEFEARLSVVPRLERHVLSPAGHMLHHDQPEALAARIETFLTLDAQATLPSGKDL